MQRKEGFTQNSIGPCHVLWLECKVVEVASPVYYIQLLVWGSTGYLPLYLPARKRVSLLVVRWSLPPSLDLMQ